MSRRFTARIRLLVTVWFFSACAAAALPGATTKWLRVEAPGFVAYSDAAEHDLIDFAIRYSAFQHAFQELFASPGHVVPPATLVLFRRESVFAAHTPPPRSAKTKLVNYSVEVDGSPLLALALSGNYESAVARTFEFETIWALRRMGYEVPMWLSQGAGEVLATIELHRGKLLVGRESKDHAEQFLVKRDLLPWPRFFAVGEDSPEYAGPGATGAFHSQAWALMHWILLGNENGNQRFLDLVARLKKNTPAIEAVQAVMATPPDRFRAAIEEHLQQAKKPRVLPFDEKEIRAGFKISMANEADVLAQTSNLLVAAGRIEESNRELDRAAQLAPERPEVKEALARRAVREHRLDDAAQLYREAVAAGSENFSTYLNSATARLDAAMKDQVDQPGTGGAEVDQALTEIRRAIALSHGNTEAYRLLGRALWVKADISEAAIDELNPGVVESEAGQRVRYYRALLNSRLGRTADAISDLQHIIADPESSEDDRRRARERLDDEKFRIAAAAVETLAQKKDFPAARQALASAEQQNVTPGTVARYKNLEAWLREEEMWNDLVTKAEEKKWQDLGDGARRFLDEFPRSPRLAAVQKLEAEAQRMQAQQTP